MQTSLKNLIIISIDDSVNIFIAECLESIIITILMLNDNQDTAFIKFIKFQTES